MDDTLVVHVWIPYDTPIGVGGRVIVQVIQPHGTALYSYAHSATMDEWHHGKKSYYLDVS
jgi:hypothetical protein